MKNKAVQTRILILLSAARVIVQEGVQNFTLDSAAAAAGVSKGGLLYHFASKDALILGMIDLNVQRFEERLSAHLEAADTSIEAWIRAFIEATLEVDEEEQHLSSALIAAIAINPHLLEPLRIRYRTWQDRFDQAAHPSIARIIRFALDGWWISTMLSLAPPTESERVEFQATLLNLLKEN